MNNSNYSNSSYSAVDQFDVAGSGAVEWPAATAQRFSGSESSGYHKGLPDPDGPASSMAGWSSFSHQQTANTYTHHHSYYDHYYQDHYYDNYPYNEGYYGSSTNMNNNLQDDELSSLVDQVLSSFDSQYNNNNTEETSSGPKSLCHGCGNLEDTEKCSRCGEFIR